MPSNFDSGRESMTTIINAIATKRLTFISNNLIPINFISTNTICLSSDYFKMGSFVQAQLKMLGHNNRVRSTPMTII